MPAETGEIANPPTRRFVMTLGIGADSMHDLADTLYDIATDLLRQPTMGRTAGGVSHGYHFSIEENPAMTHEGYIAALDEWRSANGGPLPLHNRPDGTPCNYAAMTKSNGQWVCTKCGAGGSANGGSDG